jgi:2-dehydropantoate 2-reductase
MNAVIYGAGAIGCHIAYCLYKAGCRVYLVSRGSHFQEMKQKGLTIQLRKNEDLIKQSTINEEKNFIILNNINDIKSKDIDYIFITVKLKDYNQACFKDVSSIVGNNTAIVPPCTNLPFWWLQSLEDTEKKNFSNYKLNSSSFPTFNLNNVIGMTMWLSAVVESPGKVIVRHVQRGYPLKELFPKMKNKADKLRGSFSKSCISPEIQNIHSEIFTKSLNALAFNLVALDSEYNNSQLKESKTSIESIKKVMNEGEQITEMLKIKLRQTASERIEQTLSSTVHTMSMLHDYKNRKTIELRYLWESFENVIKTLRLNMDYTESLIKKVLKKTDKINNKK